MLTAPLTDGTNEPKNVCYSDAIRLPTAIPYHEQLFIFQIIKTALDLNRLNFLNNDRIGSVMSLIAHKGRLAPEDAVEFEKGGFGEVLKKIVTKPFEFYFSAQGYHWLMMEYVVFFSANKRNQTHFFVCFALDYIFFIGYFWCDIVFCVRCQKDPLHWWVIMGNESMKWLCGYSVEFQNLAVILSNVLTVNIAVEWGRFRIHLLRDIWVCG